MKISIPIRVYYEDTDVGGVVYYANYLKFFERARTELLRAQGCGLSELTEREGVVFVVRSITVDYLRAARLDDLLEATAELTQVGRASMAFSQALIDTRSGRLSATAQVKAACVRLDSFRPVALPQIIKDNLKVGEK